MIPPAVRALFRNTPTIAPVSNRAIISIVGSQAGEFLNGVVASTVPKSPDCHFYTAFLHSQGRVLQDAFVYSHTTPEGKKGYLLELDARPSEAPPLLAMLKRYVLRSKVRLRDVTDEYDVWAAWGSEHENNWETERQWSFARSGAIEPEWNTEGAWHWGTQAGILRDRRGFGMGNRLLVRKGDRPWAVATHDTAPQEAYQLHRILHGVPEGITDIVPTQAFPIESNLDMMGALDFRKGCYVGQELTVRTYHTGVVRKRIFPIYLHPSGSPDGKPESTANFPANLDIRANRTASTTDGTPRVRPRGTNKLLSSLNGVGLALLRLEQVQAVERGEATFELEIEGNSESEKTKWTATHWRPEWWPVLPTETD